MTINEKDEMFEQLLVDCDAAMAASMHSEEGTVIEYKVSNEDFVWSSE
jgi:hypothetical protein